MICIKGAWSGSGALPQSLSWLAGVLSSPLSLSWLDPGACDRAQHLALQTPTSLQAKSRFETVCGGRGRQRVPFMHLPNALHLTLPTRYPHCSGCHFELKQAGFTAAYRARQHLLTSRSTFFSILRAGLLQPRGSESGTWHTPDASPCMSLALRQAYGFEATGLWVRVKRDYWLHMA
jgi:hypothetical protein